MRTFNARLAIYCDVEVEVPESFDINNFKDEELDALIDQAFANVPVLSDPESGKMLDIYEYEVCSIWDKEKNIPIYESY